MGFGDHVHELCGIAIIVWIGVQWNTFNLIVTILQQWKTGSIQTVGLIISSISLSNAVLEVSCLSLVFAVFMDFNFYTDPIHPLLKTMLFFWLGSSCVSFWSIAWLSVFYCVKVVSFSTECFRALKRNISSVINGVLLLTYLGTCLLFTPLFTLRCPGVELNATDTNDTLKSTQRSNLSFAPWINMTLYTLAFVCFLCPFPLMIMLPMSLRLVAHLCGHTLALRRNQTHCQSADSYLLVCKLTVSLVAVYLTTLAIVSLFLIGEITMSSFGIDLIVFGFSFYCIVTGMLLTASNKYLKEKLWSLCCCRKPPEPSSKSQTGNLTFCLE